MAPTVIAALVKDQQPEHAEHRGWDFIEMDGLDGQIVIQCSCNTRLTLNVPKTAAPSADDAPAKAFPRIKVTDAS